MRALDQRGITLVEIVIGMALLSSTILTSTLTYTAIARLQQKGTTVRTVQDNGRYILENIVRDTRNSALILSKEPGTPFPAFTTVNTQEIGGAVTYQWDNVGQRLYRCLGNTNCTAATGTTVGGKEIRVTDAKFTYFNQPGAKPFLKIALRIEQEDNSFSTFSEHAAAYDISTIISPREVNPDSTVAATQASVTTTATYTPGATLTNGVQFQATQNQSAPVCGGGNTVDASAYNGQTVILYSQCPAPSIAYTFTYKGAQNPNTFIVSGKADFDIYNPGSPIMRIQLSSVGGRIDQTLTFDNPTYTQHQVDMSALKLKDGDQITIGITFTNDSCTGCSTGQPNGDRNAYVDFLGILSGGQFH